MDCFFILFLCILTIKYLFIFFYNIPEAVLEIFSKAAHMHYSMQIYTNMKNKGFRKLEMKIGFWNVSKAYTNNYLKDIEDVDAEALNWLKNIKPKT
jgi:hypothetical protein